MRIAGERVELSALKFALLTRLAADPRRVFAKDERLREVWGFRARAERGRSTATPAGCGASSPSTARRPS